MTKSENEVRELARQLECFTENELAMLSATERATLGNWRTKRIGPPFVRIGNSVLYPITTAREWIVKNTEHTQPRT